MAIVKAIRDFLRLLAGDTSSIPAPDLSPLDHAPSARELMGVERR
jgi:hypothetical protein